MRAKIALAAFFTLGRELPAARDVTPTRVGTYGPLSVWPVDVVRPLPSIASEGESTMLRFILGSVVIAALVLTYSVNSAIAWAALAAMFAYNVIGKRRRRAFSGVSLS